MNTVEIHVMQHATQNMNQIFRILIFCLSQLLYSSSIIMIYTGAFALITKSLTEHRTRSLQFSFLKKFQQGKAEAFKVAHK